MPAVGARSTPAAPTGRLRRHVASVVTAAGPPVLVGALGALQLAPPSEEPAELWLLLLQTVPLLVRRSRPVPVLVVVASGATVQALIGLPQTNVVLGVAVAASTVVSGMAWPRSVSPPLVLFAVGVVAAVIGGHPTWPRSVITLAVVLLLAWVLGDAVGCRRAVAAEAEQDLAARRAANLLRTRVAAAGERLRIERGLHERVGAGLDAVLAQAGAARLRRGYDAGAQLAAIETVGREVLAELDRVMNLLRSTGPSVPTGGTERTADPVAGRDRRSSRSTGRVPLLVDVVIAGGVAALALHSALAMPERTASVWVIVLVAAGTAPLALRRRLPEPVLLAVTVALAVQMVVGLPANDGLLAVAVAVHALATCRTSRRSAALAVLGVGGLVVVALVAAPGVAVQLGLGLGLFVVGALYIGGAARLAAIHDASRAERLATAEVEGRLRAQAVVMEQWSRAASDLHDSVGHAVSLIVVLAGGARLAAEPEARVAAEPAEARVVEALVTIERCARTVLAELDARLAAVSGSTPVPHDPTVEDLRDLAANVHAAGVPVTLMADGMGGVPSGVARAVFRLVQEALTNVVKHAPGAAATVRVEQVGGVVLVRVSNTAGAGGRSALPSGARGLAGMRERVGALGGVLTAGPAAEGGFVVAVSIPVPAGHAAVGS